MTTPHPHLDDFSERWTEKDCIARDAWRAEGLSWARVAEHLGRTAAAVKSRLYRERKRGG